MLPREHGAYGQFLFPLGTALAIGRPRAAAVAIVAVAICVFLAHEPLLVLLGQRGRHAVRVDRQRAQRLISILGAAALGLGVAVVVLSASSVRLALVAPAALGIALLITIVVGREHSVGGEILSALTFASIGLPVAVAAGVTQTAALTCAVVYAITFGSATAAVHAVIDYTRRSPALVGRVVAAGVTSGSFIAVSWLASRGTLEPSAPWAALPPCLISGVLAALPPSAKRLRVVGWMLIATSLATAIVLIVTLR